jgi:hypothetical protein
MSPTLIHISQLIERLSRLSPSSSELSHAINLDLASLAPATARLHYVQLHNPLTLHFWGHRVSILAAAQSGDSEPTNAQFASHPSPPLCATFLLRDADSCPLSPTQQVAAQAPHSSSAAEVAHEFLYFPRLSPHLVEIGRVDAELASELSVLHSLTPGPGAEPTVTQFTGDSCIAFGMERGQLHIQLALESAAEQCPIQLQLHSPEILFVGTLPEIKTHLCSLSQPD